MKKYLNIIVLITAVILIIGACDDPVFYAVMLEVEPRDPIIEGKPANILAFNDALYTASGENIYTYPKDSKTWIKIPSQPGGMITYLAKSGDYLYALCYDDNSNKTIINRTENGSNWEPLGKEDESDNSEFRSMYSAGDKIFIGAEESPDFKIFYIDVDDLIKPLLNSSGELCGAAASGGVYYLITKGKGAYKITDPVNETPQLIAGSDNLLFTGIINLEDASGTLISILRNGSLCIIGDSVIDTGISLGYNSTGALAIWRYPDNPGEPVLLLAGRQNKFSNSSSYSYGYLEIELVSTGIKPGASFREPGTQPSSLDDNDRFKSTIGKQPVNHIFQTPSDIDPEMILFASTQKNGLWSYRERDGKYQWNAED